jgi:hypothetical protein
MARPEQRLRSGFVMYLALYLEYKDQLQFPREPGNCPSFPSWGSNSLPAQQRSLIKKFLGHTIPSVSSVAQASAKDCLAYVLRTEVPRPPRQPLLAASISPLLPVAYACSTLHVRLLKSLSGISACVACPDVSQQRCSSWVAGCQARARRRSRKFVSTPAPQNHDIFVRIATPITQPTLLTDSKTPRSKLGFHSLCAVPNRPPDILPAAEQPVARDLCAATSHRPRSLVHTPQTNLVVHKTVLLSVRNLHGSRAATFSQFRNGPESPKPHIPASIPHR